MGESFLRFEHLDTPQNSEPPQLKCSQFRLWLIESNEEDQWWLCLDSVMEEASLSLSEIEERLEAVQPTQALLLHISQVDKENPVWNEIPRNPTQDPLPVSSQEQATPAPNEESPKTERKPRLLKDFMGKITLPPTAAEGDQASKLPKKNKETAIGCGLLIVLCLVPVLLWFFWRPLFRTGGFAIPCAAVMFYAIRAKKLNGCTVTLALVLGLIGYGIIDSLVGIVSASDLKNPPVAIEKIARKKLPEIDKVSASIGGGENGDSYEVIITYNAISLLSEKSTINAIRLEMAEAYKEILKHRELKIHYLKINAQLQFRDKFGNESTWSNVYSTRLDKETIQKLNRDNLDSVDFEQVWAEPFVAPMFFEFMKRD